MFVFFIVLLFSHCCFAEPESIEIFLMDKYQTRSNLTKFLDVLMFASNSVEVNQGWLADSEMNSFKVN